MECPVHLHNCTPECLCLSLENHKHVFRFAGFSDIREYRYFCEETCGLDFSGMIEDLEVRVSVCPSICQSYI